MKSWDETSLLSWIQKRLNGPLQDDDSEKFLTARISGDDFLEHAGDGKSFQEAGISFGPSDRLARLAKTIVESKSYFINTTHPFPSLMSCSGPSSHLNISPVLCSTHSPMPIFLVFPFAMSCSL
jgi:hypothetical protein